MILHGSHVVLAVDDVERQNRFFTGFFGLTAHYANREFCEFVLPSGFRVAFFRPIGKTKDFFATDGIPHHASFGVTTHAIDALYAKVKDWEAEGVRASGPPKDHPWGEKSFLLIDPAGFRWEVTQSPTPDGRLVDR